MPNILKYFAIAFGLVTATAGATFQLVAYAKESEIATYKVASQMQERRIEQLEKRVDACESLKDKSAVTKPQHEVDPKAISIRIMSPSNGGTVKQFDDVKAVINGRLPNGYRAMLVVRDPLGQWWSWGSDAN